MADIILKLKQPVNVSLQTKPKDNKSAPNSAWDVIYFVKMSNGKQVGDIKKLGDCINITKNKEYFNITVSIEDEIETPSSNDYIFFGNFIFCIKNTI